MKSDKAKVNVTRTEQCTPKFIGVQDIFSIETCYFHLVGLNPGPQDQRSAVCQLINQLMLMKTIQNKIVFQYFYLFYKLLLSARTCTPDTKAAAPGGTTAAARASGISW